LTFAFSLFILSAFIRQIRSICVSIPMSEASAFVVFFTAEKGEAEDFAEGSGGGNY